MRNLKTLQASLIAAVLGVACGPLLAPVVLPAWAQNKPAVTV